MASASEASKQAEERIELEDSDQQDESDDGAQRGEQEKDAVRIDHRLAGFRKMTARFIGSTRFWRERESGLRGFR